ncbi:hypothetical protein D8W73_09440 [Citrobacter amalonaticus]|nr:hypothetical protein [Citrobacter amalonaticus]
MILYNALLNIGYFVKTAFAPIRLEAAYSLACLVFSNSNTQGYPQEWWITACRPYGLPPGKFPVRPARAPIKKNYR